MADPRTTLETVIQTAIDSALKEVHTMLPAVVQSFNPAEQTIEAQPTIQRKINGELVDLPLLIGVPLRYMKSSKYSISFPIEVGDHVWISFAERSIDTWLLSGDIQAPGDIRKHSLSDAFAIPMMYAQTEVIPDFDSSDMVIKANNGTSLITVSDSGTIAIESTGDAIFESQTKISFIAPMIEMIAETNIDITASIVNITGATAVNIISSTIINLTSLILSSTGVLTASDFATSIISSLNAHGHAPGTFVDAESRPITGKSGAPS